MSIHIEAEVAYSGWVRTTVDKLPPSFGVLGKIGFVRGRQVGLDTHIVDVKVALQAGERIKVDVASDGTVPADIPAPTLRSLPPLEHFGGWPTIAGVPMGFVSVIPDGAAYLAQFRARVGAMFNVDLWLLYYPDTPSWCRGEIRVTASNPSVPNLNATIPHDFRLTFGDARVAVIGRLFDEPLISEGTPFADGMCRAFPLVLVWWRHLTGRDLENAIAMGDGRVNAVGIEKLLADGNPVLPPNFNALAWASGLRDQAVARLHSWQPGIVGPAANSGITGEQEDEVFKRAEPLYHERGLLVTYLSALKYANRPCHHLEANGEPINLATHPQCAMWSMRPDSRIAPDLLGKPRGIADWDVPGGWWGADEEHALFNTLAAGARLTGSLALQAELSHIARNFLFEHTVRPDLSTSRPGPARAIGWTCMLAVHLWRELEDRTLAELVRARWREWFDTFAWMLPDLDIRTDDPRLGPGPRYIPWQQAVKCYGLDLAGAQFDRSQAREIAFNEAKRLLEEVYLVQNEQWTTRDVVPLKPDGTMDATVVVPTGFFNLFGCPMAPAVVLRHEPGNEHARSIWTQIRQTATLPKHTGWLVPGVS